MWNGVSPCRVVRGSCRRVAQCAGGTGKWAAGERCRLDPRHIGRPALLHLQASHPVVAEHISSLIQAPAGPSELPREVLPGGTTIEGEHYPAGIIVGTPNWAMGRNEEQYGDAFTFRPERWIVSNELDSLNPEEDVRRH